jgi:hypothetical protein
MDARAKAKKQYEDTMAELDLLEKSQKTGDEAADDLDALTKSLEAELAGDDPLKKSGMEGMDMSKSADECCTKAECCKKDCYEDCCKKDCCSHGKACCYKAKDDLSKSADEDDKETEMEKSIRLAAEDELRKAQEAEQEEYDELV